MYKVAVLTISDKCSKGEREDKSGPAVRALAQTLPGEIVRYEIVADEPSEIRKKLVEYADALKVDLVLTTGGTGFTQRDVTPEVTKDVMDREVPGIPEVMRREGYRITPRAMLSRGKAGLRGRTLIVNLPGSPTAAKESLGAILSELPHGLEMARGIKEHKNTGAQEHTI